MYDRELGGRTLTLGVSGKLYRNSLLMFDRETRTLWSHFLGAGVQGPLAGKRLTFIPSTFTTLGEWRERHPDTLVVDAGRYVPYGDDPYDPYFTSPQAGILGTTRSDGRLQPKALVLAVLQPAAKAYALEDVSRLGRIQDTLAGVPVEIVWNPAARQAGAFRVTEDGREPLPATPVFWFAWVDFFPGAPLWDPPDRPRRVGRATSGWPAAPSRPSAPVREQ